jgi:hypothetical protein
MTGLAGWPSILRASTAPRFTDMGAFQMYNVAPKRMTDIACDLMRVLMLKGVNREDRGYEYQLDLEFIAKRTAPSDRISPRTRALVRLIPIDGAVTCTEVELLVDVSNASINGSFRTGEKYGACVVAGTSKKLTGHPRQLWVRSDNWEEFTRPR